MAGLDKTFKKITSEKTLKKRFIPSKDSTLKPWTKEARAEQRQSFLNPGEIATESVADVGGVFTPDIPEPEEQTIIPIPDERTAETQARKRRAKAKTSGRESTILTEGLGG